MVASQLGSRLRLALIERLLDYGVIPLKVFTHFLHPVGVLVGLFPVDEGDTESTFLDHQFLVPLHTEPHLSIEGDPGSSASLLGQHDGDLGCLWKDDGAEGEGVRAYRRKSNNIRGGVND